MPKLPKHIEERFDEKFKCIQDDCVGGGHTCPTEDEPEGGQCQFCAEYIFPIKSFIATILEERMAKILKKFDEGDWVSLSPPDWNDENIIGYNSAKDDFKNFIINLIKDNEDNT